MPGLRLFTSNCLELLADKLADEIRTPLSSPLKKEVIVVQSKGMERWISLHLAHRQGICANCSFPFPNTFLYEIFRTVLPDLPRNSPLDAEIMTWKIMRLLPSCLDDPAFESLGTYLGSEEKGLKLFQLSERIADLFDQYLIFRPDMILEWQKGKGADWQAILWRKLVAGNEENHRAAARRAFFEAIRDQPGEVLNFPERISVFGVSALPPFHLEVIGALSRFVQVNLFIMNPCREYWADIVTDHQAAKLSLKGGGFDSVRELLHLEKGNSLLASMGILGRNFFSLIHEFECEEHHLFREPGEASLLSSIQSDILNLYERGETPEKQKVIREDDHSVQIHSCHSPMREIEVLHDRLLAMFDADSNLMPKDILVMAPDIENYAPFIQAVFGGGVDGLQKIPFSIADRSIKHEAQIIDPFLSLLDLWKGRLGASEVIGILESPPVRRKFGLSEKDLLSIVRWVKETRIRWGIDEQSRRRMGLPGFAENTWQAGLERLLLGYAMPGGEERLFKGILPYDHIEGGEAQTLGRFLHFIERLFTALALLQQSHRLDEWSILLGRILEDFFEPSEEAEWEVQTMRGVFNDLAAKKEDAGFDEPVDMEVVKAFLSRHFQKQDEKRGFITGGVTFSAMVPMRSIPFKVVCLVGMNAEAYPRTSRQLSFDLMASQPRLGDRSRKYDDRYLFLETLLSARNILYISYVGQNIQDNSVIPPSVVVSELMDYIHQGFRHPVCTSILDHIVTKHRLQAFSPAYFRKEGPLFSYSEENYRAALCLREGKKTLLPFISKGLPAPLPEFKTLSVDHLCSFFLNPARFLLTRRLGIYLEEGDSPLEDREPFTMKDAELYKLGQFVLEKSRAGVDPAALFEIARTSGRLPHGSVGESGFKVLLREVQQFDRRLCEYQKGELLEDLEVDTEISGFRLTGRLSRIYPQGQILYIYRPGVGGESKDLKAQDHLKAWIHHLVLNMVEVKKQPQITFLIGQNTIWRYNPLENARTVLEQLLHRYWQGLTHPLHFFPESSSKYTEALLKQGKDEIEALRSAAKVWGDWDDDHSESRDVYYRRCFEGADPLDEEFMNISLEIFKPLIQKREEV
jgi:exodeoxyribonuclease V gamma subunit